MVQQAKNKVGSRCNSFWNNRNDGKRENDKRGNKRLRNIWKQVNKQGQPGPNPASKGVENGKS